MGSVSDVGFPRHPGVGILNRIVLALAAAFLTGCQVTAISVSQLEIHQALLNHSGLVPVFSIAKLRVSCAVPIEWDRLPLTSNFLYSHQQWRSPDRHVGMGVAYMHTPFLFSPQTLIWFAKSQYANSDDRSGRLIAQWTDTLGRVWFEAENDTYHIRGYAMTRGYDAWIVYSGFRVKTHPPVGEVALAGRGADSVAPLGAGGESKKLSD
jgi:hypothetical protein